MSIIWPLLDKWEIILEKVGHSDLILGMHVSKSQLYGWYNPYKVQIHQLQHERDAIYLLMNGKWSLTYISIKVGHSDQILGM